MNTRKLIFLTTCLVTTNVLANQHYVVPPTSSTRGYVPVISDGMEQQCVEIYNQAKWLGDALQNTYVDQYSAASVSAYNQQVAQHSQMIAWFNQNCAGKQSYSACKAAMELNRKNGFPAQNCY